MSQRDDKYDFDWLPGFKEMMACQESEKEKDKEDVSSQQLLPPEELQQEEQCNWNDYEYMIRMLPAAVREVWVVSDAFLDQFEYEGSSMYAEYPDKNAILKIVDAIYDKLKYHETEQAENKVDGTRGRNCYYLPPEQRTGHTPFRHVIFIVVCWNMAYRRQRYRRRKKIFSLF